MTRRKTTQSGFTLIEVVLVLAIGGLIFLLAFLAFQQVSSNRRDTQRRSDVRRILAEAENFATNTMQAYPCHESSAWDCSTPGNSTSWDSFKTQYLTSSEFSDPSTGSYTIYAYNGAIDSYLSDYFVQNNFSKGTVVYAIKAKCESGKLTTRVANNKAQIGVWVVLEKSNYCADNSD